MISPTQPLEVREKRGPLINAVLGAFAFVALAFFLAYIKEDSIAERILLVLCGLVFVGFAIIGIYRLTRPALKIRMDAQGLHTDAVPGAPMISVPWERVAAVRLWETGVKPLVVIDVIDAESLLSSGTRAGKGLLKANHALASSPFTFYPQAFGISTGEFVENIRIRQQHFNSPPQVTN